MPLCWEGRVPQCAHVSNEFRLSSDHIVKDSPSLITSMVLASGGCSAKTPSLPKSLCAGQMKQQRVPLHRINPFCSFHVDSHALLLEWQNTVISFSATRCAQNSSSGPFSNCHFKIYMAGFFPAESQTMHAVSNF